MTSKARIIQEKSVVIPIEKLLGMNVSNFVEPYYTHGEYDGNKPRNISEVIALYAHARLSERDKRIEGCVLRKLEFNKLACIAYYTWYELAWNSEAE